METAVMKPKIFMPRRRIGFRQLFLVSDILDFATYIYSFNPFGYTFLELSHCNR